MKVCLYFFMDSYLTQNKTQCPSHGLEALCDLIFTRSWPYLVLPSPLSLHSRHRPLCCFWNVLKYTVVLGPFHFPLCLEYFPQKFIRLAHSLPSVLCSKITLFRTFSVTLHARAPRLTPPVILYPLCLYHHLTLYIFLKICLPPETVRSTKAEALFLPLLYPQYLKQYLSHSTQILVGWIKWIKRWQPSKDWGVTFPECQIQSWDGAWL